MQDSKFLVTGATGLIGSALLAHLLAIGQPARGSVRHAGEVQGGRELMATGELSADTDWREALSGVDVVIHTAARVHLMHDPSSDPERAFREVNCDATLALARQAADQGVRRLVFLSTIKVNGERTIGEPFRSDNPPNPQDAYARSKLAAEQGLQALAAETGLEVVVVRPPLVYGPRVGANFLAMMRWLQRGLPLPLAHLDNRRSLVALGNLVDLLTLCATHPAAAGRTLLVADGEDLSTPELLRRLGIALHRPARLFPAPPGLPLLVRLLGKAPALQRLSESLQIDATETCALLGWRPPFSVDEELARTARWLMTR